MKLLLGIVFVFLIFLEGSISSLPLALVFLLCLTIVYQGWYVFPMGFVGGILLDSLLLRPLGGTSLFLVIFLFLVLLYKKKYEINSFPFVLFSSCFGSFVFLLIFGYQNVFIETLLSVFIGVFLFACFRIFSGFKYVPSGRSVGFKSI